VTDDGGGDDNDDDDLSKLYLFQTQGVNETLLLCGRFS